MSAQNDAAFLRMFLLILGALVAFTIVILYAANAVVASTDAVVASADEVGGSEPRLRAAVAQRVAPIGRVNIEPPPAPAAAPASEPAALATPAPVEPPAATVAQAKPVVPAPAAAAPAAAVPARSGETVSNVACNACHLLGVLGAPKVGDGDAWRPRLAAAGIDGLVHSVVNGKGNMPARGGAKVTDAEIRAAVEHMLSASGVDVTDAPPASAPAEAPAPAAAAPETTPPAMVAAAAPVAAVPAAALEVDIAKGKTVYDTACLACHATGAAGAPKLGDQALWGPRIAKGIETLNHNAVNGIGAMPAKGGRVDLADADIIAAVAYMIEQAK